ncbi:MAG: hypothetical protein E5Y32_22735 [Mesorhizobium sp.]|nr:MAG: hypothetical protein E5Y86_30915 [Mesorhizobium sp.]TIN41107.1 MAG: hypothetical protein E5Y32_22735 [Mesorhizobium sp.]
MPDISPLKGGDRMSWPLSLIFGVEERGDALKLPISPLEGEMAGRPEGGCCPTGLANWPTSSRPAFPPCRDCPCR